MIRLYRVENPDRQLKPQGHWMWSQPSYVAATNSWGRWFTNDPKELEFYLKDIPNGHVVYVDVPANEVEQYRVSNMKVKPGDHELDNPGLHSSNPEVEFYLPKAIAMKSKPLQRSE